MAAVSSIFVGIDNIPSKGTTSPVEYTVDQVSQNQVSWALRTAPIYALSRVFSLSWRKPTAKSPLQRVSLSYTHPLDRPVTDAGSNTTHIVAGSIQAKIEFIIPTLSTSAERASFMRILYQAMLDEQLVTAVTTLAIPY